MRKTRILFLTAAMLTLSSGVFSDSLKIDMRLNLNKEDPKNFLNTSLTTTSGTTTTSTKTKDGYDAISGASKKHSTKLTSTIYLDKSNKKIMPKGLRALLLFPVSDFRFIGQDSLKIEKDGENPKKITMTFEHRGNSYRIQTDEKGKAFVNFQKEKNGEIFNSFKIKLKTEEAKEEANEKSAKAGGQKEDGIEKGQENNPDRQKINIEKTEAETAETESDGFENDTFDDNADKVYAGKLKIWEKDGILRMKGTLSLVEKPVQKSGEAEGENPPDEKPADENPPSEKPELEGLENIPNGEESELKAESVAEGRQG